MEKKTQYGQNLGESLFQRGKVVTDTNSYSSRQDLTLGSTMSRFEEHKDALAFAQKCYIMHIMNEGTMHIVLVPCGSCTGGSQFCQKCLDQNPNAEVWLLSRLPPSTAEVSHRTGRGMRQLPHFPETQAKRLFRKWQL